MNEIISTKSDPSINLEYIDGDDYPIYNIFIHGYACYPKEGLRQDILKALPIGKSYLLSWESLDFTDIIKSLEIINKGKETKVLSENKTIAIAALVGSITGAIINFKRMEKRAETIGRSLNSLIREIVENKNAKINIIGHSLGARIIHYGLAFNDWSDLNINDCIMMGSAADYDSETWQECANKINGKIFNLYSEKDFILRGVTPDLRKRAGLYPLPVESNKISNTRMESDSLLVHLEYWGKLADFLEKGWDNFVLSEKSMMKAEIESKQQKFVGT